MKETLPTTALDHSGEQRTPLAKELQAPMRNARSQALGETEFEDPRKTTYRMGLEADQGHLLEINSLIETPEAGFADLSEGAMKMLLQALAIAKRENAQLIAGLPNWRHHEFGRGC